MIRNYSEDEKIKYVQGFRNSHTPIIDYCNKLNLNYEDFRKWLKEYKDLPKFGVIDLKERTASINNNSIASKEISQNIKIEGKGIKIELAENNS